MAVTIQNVKDSISAMGHGLDLSRITLINDVLNRAARNVLVRIDPASTRRITNLTNPIHDEIYSYPLPSDVKGNKIIDIRPQVNRGLQDNFLHRFTKYFERYKDRLDDIITIKHSDGTKFLRLSKDISPAPTVLHAVNSKDANGTWSVGGNASNLTEDTQFFTSGSTSLNFDLSSGNDGDTGHIQVSDMTKVDLSDHEDVSTLFVWVYFPDQSILTNVNLRWGSSTSAYWNVTETDQFDGTAFRDGWNLLGFSWNGATETGSPDSSEIDFLRVTVTYNGTAETDIRVDNIVSSLGEIYEIEYYSKFLFRSSSGTFQETVQNDSDILNLDTDSYNIFLSEVMVLIAQQSQGENSAFDINFFQNQLNDLYDRYRAENPTEGIPKAGIYYRMY